MTEIYIEKYSYHSLDIRFGKESGKKNKYFSDILWGNSSLKRFDGASLDNVKDLTRSFLKNEKEIEEIIKLRRNRFLSDQGITHAFSGVSNIKHHNQKRMPHCYACARIIDGFKSFSCDECKWLICSCGACGCGYYDKYKY